MAKITIFGLAGTGTSSAGKELARRLDYKFVSTGNIFRAKAESLGLSLYEFEKLCNTEPKYDRDLDEDVRKIGEREDDIVVESRLAWYFIPDSIKIKLACPDEERFARVARRDGLTPEEAAEKTLFRENAGRQRYLETYNINDFGDDNNFDLILNSSLLSVDGICDNIINYLATRSIYT